MSWVDEDEVTITYRTLRQAMVESAEAERERIIALLEVMPDMGVSDWADGYHEALEEVIALIKGKNE